MNIAAASYHRSKHLSESELLLATGACPWCNGMDRTTVAVLQTDPLVELLACAECHAVSASRMPTEAALGAYYGQYYDDNPAIDGDAKVTMGSPGRMGHHLASLMKRQGSGGVFNLLDFGGGDGTLAVLAVTELLKVSAIQHGRITLVDYNDRVARPLDSRIEINHVRTLGEFTERNFDVVLASAVLEHIPDGATTLTSLLGLVRPGGAFYARTPQVASFFALGNKMGVHLDFTFPGHVHDLGQLFWEGYFSSPGIAPRWRIALSKPSIVEASYGKDPFRALAAYLFKAPWYLLGRRWGFVGGWEIVVECRA